MKHISHVKRHVTSDLFGKTFNQDTELNMSRDVMHVYLKRSSKKTNESFIMRGFITEKG